MNKLLQQQIRDHIGATDEIPGSFSKLLDVISKFYDDFEKDLKTIKRSIELSSKEMIELNRKLNKEKEELLKSEDRYRSVIEQASDAIMITDQKGSLVDVNTSLCKQIGYRKEELIGLNITDLIDPEHLTTFPLRFDLLLAGQTISNERRMMHKNGTIIEAQVNVKMLPDGRILAIARDITERRNTEEALKESEIRLRQIIDLVPHFIFAKDTEGKFTLVNEAVAKAYGSTAEALVGKSDADFNPNKEEVEHFMKEDLEVINSGNTKSNLEETVTDAAGNIRILSTTKIPYNSRLGPGLLGVSVDISERKKAEKKLEESVSILETTIESTADGILVLDYKGKIIRFNKKFAELWRIPLEILETKDNEKAIAYVSDQMENPEEFVSKIKELQAKQDEVSFGIRKFKDGRIFQRYSQPRLINGNCVGRVISFRDITEQKKNEAALQESEKRLRQIIDLVPHFIFAKDANGKFIMANQAVADAYGCKVEDLIGKSDSDFNSNKEEVEHFINEDLRVINSGNPKYNMEESITDAAGNVRILSTTKIPYTARGVDVPGLLGVSVDISERKKADEALRLAQFTIENTTHAIYWIKSDSSFHMVNNAATQMLGFTFEELMELNVPGIDPFYNKEVWDGFWQALINEKFMRLITKHIRKDGTLIDVQIDTHYFRFENQEMSCAFVSDITESKIAETLLKNSEERYRQIVETAQEGIWLIDENDCTNFINKKMCEIVEYSADELMGKKIYHFMDEQSRKNALEQIERRKQGISEIHDSVFITKSGKHVWVNISTNPVLNENGKYNGALAMITNITQRKLHEELLQKSEADLEIKNKELKLKNKELEQFAYVASHDLQEPLRTTSSFAELLLQQYQGKLDEKADKYLTFITQSSDRMKVLIKDLLDYSRIGRKIELAEVDCNKMLTEVLADLGTAIKETGAEIKTEQLPVVRGYPTEIKQLFQNLIINAIKFSQKNIPPQINISVQKTSGYWQFAFKDNGIGIEEKHSERIFIIFQRLHTRNEYEGSGIGLSHCKKIVELHKGNMWVESALGKGSTFYFTIQENNIG